MLEAKKFAIVERYYNSGRIRVSMEPIVGPNPATYESTERCDIYRTIVQGEREAARMLRAVQREAAEA
jgi:hypothetical protein